MFRKVTLCAATISAALFSLPAFAQPTFGKAPQTAVPNAWDATTLILSTDTATISRGAHTIAAETGTADDLCTVVTTSLVVGHSAVLKADAGDTITIKNGGACNITTETGDDIVIAGAVRAVLTVTSSGVDASLAGAGPLAKNITSLSVLKAINSASLKDGDVRIVSDPDAGGVFVWSSADLSSSVTVDTQECAYVAPTDASTGASGAWVRHSYQQSLWLNTRWCRVAADGSTDDAAKLNAAINLLESERGGVLYFPAGRYRVNTPLNINSDAIIIQGDGSNASEIVNGSTNLNTIVFAASDPTTTRLLDVGVRDIRLSYAGTDPSAGAHVVFDRTTRGFVEDAFLVHHYRGIVFQGVDENHWVRRVAIEAGTQTTALQSGSAGIVITRRQVASGQSGAVQDSVDLNYYVTSFGIYLSDINIRSNADGNDTNLFVQSVDGLYLSNVHLGFGTNSNIKFDPVQENLPIQNVLVSNVFLDANGSTTTTIRGIEYLNSAAFSSPLINDHQFSGIRAAGHSKSAVRIAAAVDRVGFSGGVLRNFAENAYKIENGDRIIISEQSIFNTDSSSASAPAIFITGGGMITIADNQIDTGFRGVQTNSGFTGEIVVSDNIFKNLDDTSAYQSVFFSHTENIDVVDGNSSDVGKSVASAATISIPLEHNIVSVTGTTNINNIDDAAAGGRSSWDGRRVTLIFDGALSVGDAVGNIDLAGGFTTTSGDSLTVVYRNGGWSEISRSVN